MKQIQKYMASAAAVVLMLGTPSLSMAQDKNLVRSQARTTAAQFRGVGEPKDRCSLGAYIADGGIVNRLSGPTSLQLGDRLLRVQNIDVNSKTADEIVEILRMIPPTSTVDVIVRRDEADTSLQVNCSNPRPSHEAFLTALDQAAAGKFDDCVSTIASRTDLGTSGANLAMQCAALSRKSKSNTIAFAVTWMKMQIEDARWVPAQRREVIERLQSLEGPMSQDGRSAEFQRLVKETRLWPGDERAFELAKPDWAMFRRNAEAALRGRLIDPDSARFEWSRGFLYGTWKPFLDKRVEGYWTCGQVNARNRMGGYTGSSSFVVVLDRAGAVKLANMGEVRDFDILNAQCANAISLLPPAPPEFQNSVAPAASSAVLSLADELKKLSDLRTSGAITPEEFDTAKSKLLGSGR